MDTHVNREGALKLFHALQEGTELDIDGETFFVVNEPWRLTRLSDTQNLDVVRLRGPTGKDVTVSFDDLIMHLAKPPSAKRPTGITNAESLR